VGGHRPAESVRLNDNICGCYRPEQLYLDDLAPVWYPNGRLMNHRRLAGVESL
jgi:hypothetical protein